MDEIRPVFNTAVQRRIRYGKSDPAQDTGRKSKFYANYYGRWKPPGRPWTWKRLFTDKSASEKAWLAFQKEQQQVAVLGVDERTERIGRHTLEQLLELYLDHQRTACRSADHVEITENMLRRMIQITGWRTYRDIRVAAVEAFFRRPEHAAWTIEYRIAWIKKIKAFVNWMRPKTEPSPLEDLKRPSRKNAVQRKGRRVASAEEVQLLVDSEVLPLHRRMAYALGLLNGLRRGEAASLTWENVLLEHQPPVLRIPPKDPGAEREYDLLPVHPRVEAMLRQVQAEGAVSGHVLPSVPDNKTLAADLERGGFRYKNEQGRLLCFHALRHTYKQILENVGTPPTPVRQLMRHVPRTVTECYGASELYDMRQYLDRTNPPLGDEWQSSGTPGVLDRPASAAAEEQLNRVVQRLGGGAGLLHTMLRIVLAPDSFGDGSGAHSSLPEAKKEPSAVRHPVRHAPVFSGPSESSAGGEDAGREALEKLLQALVESGTCRSLSPVDLNSRPTAKNAANSGPGTQAD